MSIHIEEITSEVIVENQPGSPPSAESPETVRVQDLLAQMARNRWRTAAEGFDD
jgi:hypothetical protein